ncbi:MAG: helix-turn-helix domain-containing protein [Rhodanobacteraceae bacterium]
MARPPARSRLVDTLEGDDLAKRRLKVVIQTITGECTIAEACERLEVSETALRDYRTRALYGALAGLTPGTPGRPRNAVKDPALTRLQTQVQTQQLQLLLEKTQTQLALLATALPPPVAPARGKKKQPPPVNP